MIRIVSILQRMVSDCQIQVGHVYPSSILYAHTRTSDISYHHSNLLGKGSFIVRWIAWKYGITFDKIVMIDNLGNKEIMSNPFIFGYKISWNVFDWGIW